jgi:hypothetical protein
MCLIILINVFLKALCTSTAIVPQPVPPAPTEELQGDPVRDPREQGEEIPYSFPKNASYMPSKFYHVMAFAHKLYIRTCLQLSSCSFALLPVIYA